MERKIWFLETVLRAKKCPNARDVPAWLTVKDPTFKGQVQRVPERPPVHVWFRADVAPIGA